MKVWRYWHNVVFGGAEGIRLNSDLYNGVEFHAAPQFDTPLIVLQQHGHRHYDLNYCPPQFAERPQHGSWASKLKTLREIGIDMDEPDKGWQSFEMAIRNGDDPVYFRFLIALREIVELNNTARERRAQLHAEINRPQWARYSGLPEHHADEICSYFFPFFLATVPRLPHHTSVAMWDVALDTPARISDASDEELLAFKGIGPPCFRRCVRVAQKLQRTATRRY